MKILALILLSAGASTVAFSDPPGPQAALQVGPIVSANPPHTPADPWIMTGTNVNGETVRVGYESHEACLKDIERTEKEDSLYNVHCIPWDRGK